MYLHTSRYNIQIMSFCNWCIVDCEKSNWELEFSIRVAWGQKLNLHYGVAVIM